MRYGHRAALVIVAGALVATTSLGVGQALAQYGGGLDTSTTSGGPGDPVELSGTGFRSGTTITITFESTPVVLATTVADASGSFSETVRIPRGATPGEHTLRASGTAAGGGTRTVSAPFTVVGGGLAFTGANILLLAVIAVGLVIVGTFLVTSKRRT
jgi:hypothetical protein